MPNDYMHLCSFYLYYSHLLYKILGGGSRNSIELLHLNLISFRMVILGPHPHFFYRPCNYQANYQSLTCNIVTRNILFFQFLMSETIYCMIINHTYCLHHCITYLGAYKFESPTSKIFTNDVRFLGHRRNIFITFP